MNAGGVLGSMNFPSFPGFSGRLFAACEDKGLALAVVQAYNDWHIDELVRGLPGTPHPDGPARAVGPGSRRGRGAAGGGQGLPLHHLHREPRHVGLPSFHSDHWDPLWRAVVDEGVVVSIHLGSSGQLAVTAADAPVDVMITLQPMNICQAAADLVWSRVIKEFPDVRFALSEGGTGWIPYFIDRLDRTYDMHRLWTGQDFGDRLPSDVFREHFLTCFIADPVGIQLRAPDRPGQHCVGVRLPALGLLLARGARGAGAGGGRRAGRRAEHDQLRERLSLVLLRPVRRAAQGTVDRRPHSGRKPPATTSRSGRSTRDGSNGATPASTWARWPSEQLLDPVGRLGRQGRFR